jgi:hypothetical protein
MKQTFGKTKTMSKDDELAAKTRRQVDNAVSWIEKRYFTAKESAQRIRGLVKANKSDKNSDSNH